MTTETVEAAKVPFNIEAGRAELESLSVSYDSMMGDLVAAGQNANIAEMQRLGAEMASIAVKRDKLAGRINRAENGSGGVDIKTRISARTEAYAAIALFVESNDEVKRLLTLVPSLKAIKLTFDAGKYVSCGTVGGFKSGAVGTKRPRASWTGGNLTEAVSTKVLISLFGVKYGQTKNWDDLSTSERVALATAISSGEGLTNANAAK